MGIMAVAVAALAAATAPTLASAADTAAADIVNVDGAVTGKTTFEQRPISP